MVAGLPASGWLRISDPALTAWARSAAPVAAQAVQTSDEAWRCGGTWFVGVDALPNDANGGVGGVALPWDALPLPPIPLHRAQLSVIRPGYPQPSPDESPSAFAFRRDRAAAHLDGLLPSGPDRRRKVQEPHAWILGISLNECAADASPLVVWEGSHQIMRLALRNALAPYPKADWADVDITDAYIAARRHVFDTCRRVELPAKFGQATLLHRLCIHGVAPWTDGTDGPAIGRMIAYFRPQLGLVSNWLALP